MPPIIDPEGMFNGDRIAHLSDEAKLYWPWFFLASNGFARLELNYRKLVAKAFSSFSVPPNQQQFVRIVKEYSESLMFLYQSDGQAWGQWDTSEKFLPRHKTAADKRSPEPPRADWIRWKDRLAQRKQAQVLDLSTFSEIFGDLPEASPKSRQRDDEKQAEICLTDETKQQVPLPATISENFQKDARVVVVVEEYISTTENVSVRCNSNPSEPTASLIEEKESSEQPEPIPASDLPTGLSSDIPLRPIAQSLINRSWYRFREIAHDAGVVASEPDWTEAYTYHWRFLDPDQQKAAAEGLKARKGTDDPALRSLPKNYLKKRMWERAIQHSDAQRKIQQSDQQRDSLQSQTNDMLKEIERRKALLKSA